MKILKLRKGNKNYYNKYQMKIASYFILLLLTLVQSNDFKFRLARYHKTRGYILTCLMPGCQTAISNCIDSFKCLGIDQCRRCLIFYPECNSACANDLFNGADYVSVNSVKYLPRDDTSAEQVKACELHCRGFYFRYNECTLLDGFPICRCSGLPLSSTSLTSTSTLSSTSTSTLASTSTSSSKSTSRTSTSTKISSTITTSTISLPTTSFWSYLILDGRRDYFMAVVVLKNSDFAEK
jgi:hypothetical protein